MNANDYKRILKAWCPHLSPEEALVCAFKRVRDIPYGSIGERKPQQIIQRNLGSCSGKHLLLSRLFETQGYDTRIVTCMHYFNDAMPSGNVYPTPLLNILSKERVIDFHHYVLLKRAGTWLTVDATWDIGLSALGFPVNTSWNGRTDTALAVVPVKYYDDTNDLIGLKKKLLSELPPHDRRVRLEFMRALTQWLESVRSRP